MTVPSLAVAIFRFPLIPECTLPWAIEGMETPGNCDISHLSGSYNLLADPAYSLRFSVSEKQTQFRFPLSLTSRSTRAT